MIIKITEVTSEYTSKGSEYLKVKGITPDNNEVTKSVFDNLKDFWDLLEVGNSVDFTLEQKGKYWNVVGIKPVKTDDNRPPLQKSHDEHSSTPQVAPQERGMWWKEVGENFRAGLFKKDDGGAGEFLWKAYIKQMFISLELKYNKEVKEEGYLTKEAKKLGAKETEKGED